MLTLTEFLLARIAEDEATAKAASPGPWSSQGGGQVMPPPPWSRRPWETNAVAECRYGPIKQTRIDGDHIARWDPARVLAECEAKRRIIELCGGWVPDRDVSPLAADYILGLLAVPYAGHPDYDEEWRP